MYFPLYASRQEMRKAIITHSATLSLDLEEEAVLKACLALITQICGDIQSIADAIEGALSALNDLKRSFTEQQIGFQNLANQWSTINNSAGQSGSADEAALDMKPSVESAQASWAEIRQLALDFQTHAPIVYNYYPAAP
ncbi:hypothetical protein FB567DRAFT_585045 [Paraphoma chrysanthemicola]|uniref:Uncharacterized protein n=1 Tax=Paraphoma chrysanthemicola TaxID=798071 RepID=A0A8K0VSD8_9PLEO|nr:hypothetical protein FB567DRAFT_585045 [Paraphoma chrysanthemicola]